MRKPAGDHAAHASGRTDTNQLRRVLAGSFTTQAFGRVALASHRGMTEPRNALPERLNRVKSHPGLPALASGVALRLHHTQPAVRILEAGLLCLIAQRFQQPGSSFGEAWPAYPARPSVGQP